MFLRICASGACFLNVTTFFQALVAIIIIVTILKSIGGHPPEEWIRLPIRGPRVLTIRSRDGRKVLATVDDREDEFSDAATIHITKEIPSPPDLTIGGSDRHRDTTQPHALPSDAAVFNTSSSSRRTATAISPSWQEIVDDSPRFFENAEHTFDDLSNAGADKNTKHTYDDLSNARTDKKTNHTYDDLSNARADKSTNHTYDDLSNARADKSTNHTYDDLSNARADKSTNHTYDGLSNAGADKNTKHKFDDLSNARAEKNTKQSFDDFSIVGADKNIKHTYDDLSRDEARNGTRLPPPEDLPWSYSFLRSEVDIDDSSFSSENWCPSDQTEQLVQDEDGASLSESLSSSLGGRDYILESVNSDVIRLTPDSDNGDDEADALEEKTSTEGRRASELTVVESKRASAASPRRRLLSQASQKADKEKTGKHNIASEGNTDRELHDISTVLRSPRTNDITVPPPAKRQRTATCGRDMLVLEMPNTDYIYVSKTHPLLAIPLPIDRSSELERYLTQRIQKLKQSQTQTRERGPRQTLRKNHKPKRRQVNVCKDDVSEPQAFLPVDLEVGEVATCQQCQNSSRNPSPQRARKSRTPGSTLQNTATESTSKSVAVITPAPLTPWWQRGHFKCIMKPKPAVPRQARRSAKPSVTDIKSNLSPQNVPMKHDDTASDQTPVSDASSLQASHKRVSDVPHLRTTRNDPSHFRKNQKMKLHPYLKSKSNIRQRSADSHDGFKRDSGVMTESLASPPGVGLQTEEKDGERQVDRSCSVLLPTPTSLSKSADFATNPAATAPKFDITIQGSIRILAAADASAALPLRHLKCQSTEARSTQEKVQETHSVSNFFSHPQKTTFKSVSTEITSADGPTLAPNGLLCTSAKSDACENDDVKSDACEDDNSIDKTIRLRHSGNLENCNVATSVGFRSSTDPGNPTDGEAHEFAVTDHGDPVDLFFDGGKSPSLNDTRSSLQLYSFSMNFECFADNVEGSGMGSMSSSSNPYPVQPIPIAWHDLPLMSSNEEPQTQEPSIAEAGPQSPNPEWDSDCEPISVSFEGSNFECSTSQFHNSVSRHPPNQEADPLGICQYLSSVSLLDYTVKSSHSSSDVHTGLLVEHLSTDAVAQETEREDAKLQSLQLLQSSLPTVPTNLGPPGPSLTEVKVATGSTCASGEAKSTSIDETGAEARPATPLFSFCETCRAFPRYKNTNKQVGMRMCVNGRPAQNEPRGYLHHRRTRRAG